MTSEADSGRNEIDRETLVREVRDWIDEGEFSAEQLADRILALARRAESAHLDRTRAEDVLDWCKREGGLDLYGWGDLISRLNDCIVPTPLDAPARMAAAYRDGFREGQKYPEVRNV